jgi:hypothetical protein
MSNVPKQGRMDIPGRLNHVISREIKRREIFIDD